MKISNEMIKKVWIRFSGLTNDERLQTAQTFKQDQPHVCEYVEEQDREWFPDSPPTIRSLALFIWLVFLTSNQGKVPKVLPKTLALLLSQDLETMDKMADESEFKIQETYADNLRKHPQLDLYMFVFGYLHRKEDNAELTPTKIKAAAQHLNVVIRAFDAVC